MTRRSSFAEVSSYEQLEKCRLGTPDSPCDKQPFIWLLWWQNVQHTKRPWRAPGLPANAQHPIGMTNNNLVTLAVFGRVLGTHGLIYLRSFADPTEGLFTYPPPFLCGKDAASALGLIRFTEHHQQKDKFTVRVAGYDDAQRLTSLVNKQVFIRREQMVAPKSGYYWHDLVGMRVRFCGNNRFAACNYGIVTGHLPSGNQDLMRIKPDANLPFPFQGKELLIPFIERTYVKRVDMHDRCITVDWPPDFF